MLVQKRARRYRSRRRNLCSKDCTRTKRSDATRSECLPRERSLRKSRNAYLSTKKSRGLGGREDSTSRWSIAACRSGTDSVSDSGDPNNELRNHDESRTTNDQRLTTVFYETHPLQQIHCRSSWRYEHGGSAWRALRLF